jgi:hypothetical protein
MHGCSALISGLRHTLVRTLTALKSPPVRAAVTQTKLDTLVAVLSTLLFVVTAWFSQATFTLPSPDSTKLVTPQRRLAKLWQDRLTCHTNAERDRGHHYHGLESPIH